MYESVRVIAIDDQQSELDAIIRGLHSAGLPCLGVKYDTLDGVTGSIQQPLHGVRLLFTDVNLLEFQNPSPEQTIGPIGDLLKTALLPDNGPYALIFWSKHAHLVDDLKRLLRQRYPAVAHPTVIGVLSKTELQGDADALRTSIKTQIELSPQLSSLIQWENRVGEAAAKTLSVLYALPSGDYSPEEIARRTGVILSKIAHEAAGFQNSQDEPVNAIESGLEPILLDNLLSASSSGAYANQWKNAFVEFNNSKLLLPDGVSPSDLNSWCHLEWRNIGGANTSRGAVVALSERYADDTKFSELFGISTKEMFNDFLNFEGCNTTKDDRTTARELCEWKLIEISAGCDYAQRKKRIYRYMLALRIPYYLYKFTVFGDRKNCPRDRCHDAIYRFPILKDEHGEFVLKTNFRYVLGLVATSPVLGQFRYRIRTQLIDLVSSEQARYSARLGIIAYR